MIHRLVLLVVSVVGTGHAAHCPCSLPQAQIYLESQAHAGTPEAFFRRVDGDKMRERIRPGKYRLSVAVPPKPSGPPTPSDHSRPGPPVCAYKPILVRRGQRELKIRIQCTVNSSLEYERPN